MKEVRRRPLVLPALRGTMGNWVYYSCLLGLEELAARVDYADEIHKSKHLSDMIQRQLASRRAGQIAEYLATQQERLFNSLVVATYDGQPNWYALSNVNDRTEKEELKELSEETINSVGFLTFRGDEKLFALDGQHRLAGIKKAVADGIDQDPYDEVPVIFVSHKNNTQGIQRTRRLFTTLNKSATPVSKGDIIALDEDDVMALSVRWLIDEEGDLFRGNRIAFVASNNMPSSNVTSLTTIGSLYDFLAIMFTDAKTDWQKKKRELQRVRPDDAELKSYFDLSKNIFLELRKNFEELEEFFSSEDTAKTVKRYRGQHGGSVWFRPIGLVTFGRVIARLTDEMGLPEAVQEASKLPTSLEAPPLVGLMWDSSRKTMANFHQVTVREILLYMLGKSKLSETQLVERYRKDMANESLELPKKVV